MSKSKTFVLPASGHALWVAHFEPVLFDQIDQAEDLHRILEVQPIIGWIYTHHKDRDESDPALELTPFGPILPGVSRYVGQDREEAREAGMKGLSAAWEKYRHNQRHPDAVDS